MSIVVKEDQQTYHIVLDGEVEFCHLSNLLEFEHQIADAPLDTHVEWAGANWVHYVCLQALLCLKKTLAESGHRLSFEPAAPEFGSALQQFAVKL